ncbi:MAG TPA: MFS transporter [Polyangiaceae bacterium]|nr:MFS transporter [Polyangiaceae bacterium]
MDASPGRTNHYFIVKIPGGPQLCQAVRARIAVSLLFLVDGAGFGTWAALLASLQRRLALDEARLSVALGVLVVGALLGMPLAGWANERFGSRAVLRVLAPAFCVALVGPALAPTYALLLLFAFVFGALKGAFDVTINAQAIVVQAAMGRSILSSLHALWSLGGLGLAALSSAALQRGLAASHLTELVALGLLVVAGAATRGLLDSPSSPAPKRGGAIEPIALRLGALAFLALFAEGTLMDWSAVFASRVLGVSEAVAPIAYGVFSGTMAVGRLLGDRAIEAVGAKQALRAGAALTALGLTLVASAVSWPLNLVGTGLAGLGLSNLVPVLFGATARLGSASARAIAAVSTIGYLGFLAGPPTIGGIAHSVGLPAAFLLVAVLALSLLLVGPMLLGTQPSDSRPIRTTTPFQRTQERVAPW